MDMNKYRIFKISLKIANYYRLKMMCSDSDLSERDLINDLIENAYSEGFSEKVEEVN